MMGNKLISGNYLRQTSEPNWCGIHPPRPFNGITQSCAKSIEYKGLSPKHNHIMIVLNVYKDMME